MLSYGVLKKAKNVSVFNNSFPYSADVKPTVNKNQFYFDLVPILEHALSM